MLRKIDAVLKLLSPSRVLNTFFITSRLVKKKELLYDAPKRILFNREKQVFYIDN